MKLQLRNTTEFEYLPYTDMETDLNEYGEHTGEFHPIYGKPVPYRGNISTPGGRENQTFYGEDIRYTHTLMMDNPKVKINEYGLIRWKGELYDIESVKPSLNSVSIALKKQTKDHPDPYVEPEGGN